MTIKNNFPDPFTDTNMWKSPTISYPSITVASNTSPKIDEFVWGSGDYVGDTRWSLNSDWKISINPDLNVEGDIKLKGRSLTETLDKIEERLAILRPNPELEDRWEELKLLGEKYRELEKELLEKEEMWKLLNK